MGSFDHFCVPVKNYEESRDWYVTVLGLEVEFDAGERRTVAVRDGKDLTFFLYEASVPQDPAAFGFWFQVDDVEAVYQRLSGEGVEFQHGPKMVEWGYGAELRDPNGYRIMLWDEKTMPKAKSH